MTRSFALTYAAVMLRIYLPVAMIVGLEFARRTRSIAWLCWLPNLARRPAADRVGPTPDLCPPEVRPPSH